MVLKSHVSNRDQQVEHDKKKDEQHAHFVRPDEARNVTEPVGSPFYLRTNYAYDKDRQLYYVTDADMKSH